MSLDPSQLAEWAGRLGGPGALTVATVLVIAEAALLIGVVLPGIWVPVGVGLLAAAGVIPPGAGLAVAAGAAVIGPSVGFWLGRRPSAITRRPRRLPAVAARLLELLRGRPRLAVAAGQWFAVSRTLVPRLAGTELSYPQFALVNVPVAAAWGAAAFVLGRLIGDGSELATRVLSVWGWVGTVLLVVVGVLVVVAVIRAARTAAGRGSAVRLRRR